MYADGLVDDEQVDCAVEHAQRVAEGVNYEIHRNTWRYSVVIEQQRKALSARRERLLTTDVAAAMLSGRSCRRSARRSTTSCSSRVARSIALLPPGPAAGPSTWRSWPRCGRACTCGRWAGWTRSTSSTAPRCRRSTRLLPEIERRTIETFEEIELDRGLAAGRGQAGPS